MKSDGRQFAEYAWTSLPCARNAYDSFVPKTLEDLCTQYTNVYHCIIYNVHKNVLAYPHYSSSLVSFERLYIS